MKVIGVIPARFASTRFPGKPLHPILGRPLIAHVIENAKKCQNLNDVWVATDHDGIAQVAEGCGVRVVMTNADLPSGSDRVWAAVTNEDCDVVVNIQGDEPLLQPAAIDALVAPLMIDRELQMTTLARPIRPSDLQVPTTAKVIINKRYEALYFSRFAIPYSRATLDQVPDGCMKHIGVYAYRKPFLETFCRKGPVAIEIAEGLEQLRALYLGARLRVVRVDEESWGVDTPGDVEIVEKLMRQGQV